MTKSMTREEIKKYIIELVENGPIKATEIAGHYPLIKMVRESNLDLDIPILLNELVEQDRILEIEYVLPKMDYRIKSIYMPKGTEVVIKGGARGS